MWVFLGSEILLFTGFFALYAAYQAMYPDDFAAAIGHDNVAIGTTNTLVLITSSLFVALAVREVRDDRAWRAGWALTLGIALGAVFLVLKGIEYRQHFHEG